VPACLYALFCFWYTDCGGPLRSDEIQGYVAAFERQGATPERLAMLRRFMETDSGRQFLMVNALDMAKDLTFTMAGCYIGLWIHFYLLRLAWRAIF
jgi:hypothetical protein